MAKLGHARSGTMVAMAMNPADPLRAAPVRRFVAAVDPDRVPDPELRRRLCGSPPDPSPGPVDVSPWVGTGVVLLLSVSAMVAAVTTHGGVGGVLLAFAALTLVGFPVWHWVWRWRELATARQRGQLSASDSVVTGEQQQEVAGRVPELGERLARSGYYVERLRQPWESGGLGGILPGVDDDVLDRVHHRIVARLTECADLAEAVDEAAGRPSLASLVAARRGDLAAVREAVDVQLDQLARLVAAAEAIDDLQAEADLAERLVTEPAPAATRSLPQPATTDLPGLLAAAEAALELHGIGPDQAR
jgi:hypothetical protein